MPRFSLALTCFAITDEQHGGGQHGNQGGRETGFEEIGDGTSRLVTEGTGEDTGTYKPTEHGGQKEDGGQDKRVSSEHGFGKSPCHAADAHHALLS